MKYTPQQRAKDWSFIWATPEGKRAIADFYSANCMLAGIFHQPGADPATPLDPIKGWLMEGRRNAALDIVQALGVTSHEIDKMVEAMKETG